MESRHKPNRHKLKRRVIIGRLISQKSIPKITVLGELIEKANLFFRRYGQDGDLIRNTWVKNDICDGISIELGYSKFLKNTNFYTFTPVVIRYAAHGRIQKFFSIRNISCISLFSGTNRYYSPKYGVIEVTSEGIVFQGKIRGSVLRYELDSVKNGLDLVDRIPNEKIQEFERFL